MASDEGYLDGVLLQGSTSEEVILDGVYLVYDSILGRYFKIDYIKDNYFEENVVEGENDAETG